MMRWLLLWTALLAGLGATPARAEWLQATSRHFVLYGDTSEASLRRRAVALERLDWGLRRIMASPAETESAANRLTVFLVSEADVRRLCRCTGVAGFYIPRVGGSVAYSATDGADPEQARNTLNHEYAHHYLLGSYDLAFPAWFNEGFAEFAGTATVTPEKVTIGAAAQGRAYGLFNGERFRTEQLFDNALWGRLKGLEQFDAFYGRGWLLAHYVTVDLARRKQFERYLTLLNAGTPGVAAGREAFGDLRALDRALEAYLHRSRISAFVFPTAGVAEPAIAVRRLSAGEAALIRLRMESTRGVGDATAKPLYAKAAPIAARYPDDAVVQGWFAEMAYDAKEDAAAAAAATRAVALDPRSPQGLLYQGRVRLRALEARKDASAAEWTDARKPIVAANRLDPDDAEPLWLFWASFAQEGRAPVKSAFAGLYRAQELAPQDQGVRFAAALARVKAGERDEAKRLLRPIAFDPHAGADNPAAKLLAALEAGKAKEEALAVVPDAAP